MFSNFKLIFLEPTVQKFVSKLTVPQIKLDLQGLFDGVNMAIIESSFYSNQPVKTRNQNVYAVLVLDSHWDPVNKTILRHKCAGNSFSNPKLGIFGSHLTHGWPENEDQLISRFTDARNLDFSQVANDDSLTKYRALDAGIGCLLFTIGIAHTLGIFFLF